MSVAPRTTAFDREQKCFLVRQSFRQPDGWDVTIYVACERDSGRAVRAFIDPEVAEAWIFVARRRGPATADVAVGCHPPNFTTRGGTP